MGFDDRFIRMWEYYLALSEAGFATGISQDLQIVFEKRRGVAPGLTGGGPAIDGVGAWRAFTASSLNRSTRCSWRASDVSREVG